MLTSKERIYRRFSIHSRGSLSLVIPKNKTLKHWRNTHVWIYKLDLITRLVWKSDNGHQASNQIYPVFMTWLPEMNKSITIPMFPVIRCLVIKCSLYKSFSWYFRGDDDSVDPLTFLTCSYEDQEEDEPRKKKRKRNGKNPVLASSSWWFVVS